MCSHILMVKLLLKVDHGSHGTCIFRDGGSTVLLILVSF
uniref:Uncharacterized protein n=1 Tax=Aegilops tauschii subsp. strangulata TaxID=200361 RepID=A0A453IQA0_AEGTS